MKVIIYTFFETKFVFFVACSICPYFSAFSPSARCSLTNSKSLASLSWLISLWDWCITTNLLMGLTAFAYVCIRRIIASYFSLMIIFGTYRSIVVSSFLLRNTFLEYVQRKPRCQLHLSYFKQHYYLPLMAPTFTTNKSEITHCRERFRLLHKASEFIRRLFLRTLMC